MSNERLDKQIEFCREIDKEKFIKRQTYLTDGIHKENDAEHAWHMAIMTVLLSEYANENIDILKTVIMLLIHDIVEIDAGDTYAYDSEAVKTQREREVKAAERILVYFPKTKPKNSEICGKNLSKAKRLKRNSHILWIIFRLLCLILRQMVKRGLNIRFF